MSFYSKRCIKRDCMTHKARVEEIAVPVSPQVHTRVGAVGALAELHVDKPRFMGEPLIF